jgi:hypothetical protein
MNSFIKQNASSINDKTTKLATKETVQTTTAPKIPATVLKDKKYSSSDALANIGIYIDTGHSNSIDKTECIHYQPYTMDTLHGDGDSAHNLASNAKIFDGAIVPSTKCHSVKLRDGCK